MTRRNDVIPSPSHPRSRKIRFGIKIRKNIDIINRITRIVNRWRNGSVCIYEDENFRTLAEIRRIVEAKISALLSRSTGSLRWKEEIDMRSHSMMRVVEVKQA